MSIGGGVAVAGCLLGLLWAAGCYPSFTATTRPREMLGLITEIESPSKIYLRDGSVVLFPKGFFVRGDTVTGEGVRYWIEKSDTHTSRRVVPLDSVIAATSYDSYHPGGEGVASFLQGVFGTSATALSIYCLSCPKCCFGSCPTVYTFDRTAGTLQAELFSHSISLLLEDRDLDLLDYRPPPDSQIHLRLTNEALETHYINEFSLLGVSHPAGTRVFPSASGSVVLFDTMRLPSRAVARNGQNVMDLLAAADSLAYRTGLSAFPRMAAGGEQDWIDLSVNVPKGVRKVNMLVRLKNTLLSTMLFYDVVLGSQGIDALNWIHRMNTDRDYATRFKRVYDAFSGVSVVVLRQGRWVPQAPIEDAGPIAWKSVALEFDNEGPGEFCARLSFFPDNVEVDYVGFSFEGDGAVRPLVSEVRPLRAFDGAGAERNDILPLLSGDDDRYLVTNPGDAFDLYAPAPGERNGEFTLFVSSRGYYNEWLRGSWMRTPADSFRFDLTETQATISRLVNSWISHKEEIERTFFQSRIPVRRGE